MRCDEARPRLGALVDGELADGTGPELLAHIEGCSECSKEVADLRRLGAQLAQARVPAPTSLRQRVQAGLAQEERSTFLKWVKWPQGHLQAGFRSSLRWAGMTAAACLMSVVLTWSLTERSAIEDHLVQDALTAHLRAIVQDHVVQIASSASHTVKPWFAGRIEFSPEVKDLSSEGFPLVGGRVDFLGQERVAALIYRRRLHTVTLLMRPNPDAGPVAVKSTEVRGYNVVSWASGGTAYWMVSDLNLAELLQLQALL